MAVAPQQSDDNGQRNYRKQNQHGNLPLPRRIGKQAECSAPVLDVSDTEQAGNHRNALVQSQPAGDELLGDTVQNDDAQRDDELKLAHTADRGYSSSRRIALQRSHTVGYSASSPTWVEYVQQRSHFCPDARETSIFTAPCPFSAR